MSALAQIPEVQIALKLFAALVVGALIGLNRNLRGKPAGLRTHALVTLSTCLLVIIGLKLEATVGLQRLSVSGLLSEANALSRVIQGILQGIGFLGAGVILRSEGGQRVHGLTTAASIWLSAALGIACGTGLWALVLTGFIFAFAVLAFGGTVERFLHRRLEFLAHDEDNGN
jgi:putative Mg2+ transporter-C (MgtC) family protein